MSPSTLSRSISRMEEALDCSLFIRTSKSVKLTEAGRRFQQYAEETCQRYQQLKTDLNRLNNHITGTIRLFCSVTASYSMLPNLLMHFRSTYPDVTIQLDIGNNDHALEKVAEKQFAVAALPERASVLKIPLVQVPLVFIVSNGFPEKNIHSLKRSPYPLVLSRKGATRARVNQWIRNQKFTPSHIHEVDSIEAVVTLVSLGTGIGIVPEMVLSNSSLREQLAVLKITPAPQDLSVFLAYPNDRLDPAGKAFLQTIQSQLKMN